MKRRIYICAPLKGDIEGNVKRAIRYARYVFQCGAVPVVPHFYALCLDDAIPEERKTGMEAGRSLLWICDELWIFGDVVTEGMAKELQFCRSMNVKTRKIRDDEMNKWIGEK